MILSQSPRDKAQPHFRFLMLRRSFWPKRCGNGGIRIRSALFYREGPTPPIAEWRIAGLGLRGKKETKFRGPQLSLLRYRRVRFPRYLPRVAPQIVQVIIHPRFLA